MTPRCPRRSVTPGNARSLLADNTAAIYDILGQEGPY